VGQGIFPQRSRPPLVPEAVAAYEAGLKIAPTDAGLTSGLAEVKKATEQPKSSGIVSPALLSKLAAHPKFGPKLADPAFQAKLSMLNTNPQARYIPLTISLLPCNVVAWCEI
jgi:hypothetical protein